jgi:NADPH-dependent 2,4-dienoyl-CoA reductase/sulfur reductase-like enzyme
VTGGNIETIYMSAPPMAISEGCLVHLAEQVKTAIEIPVIAVGKIRTPALADEIIKTGKADLVAVGRGLIADAEFPKKAFDNRAAEIRPCISCNNPQCHGRTIKNLDMGCLVNPVVGRERRSYLKKTGKPKKILIAGAGPAGLEAARVSALRGHHPILCEKASGIGGQLRFGCVPPHKEEIQRLINYYSVQLETLNVELKTDCEVTSQLINELNPDAIFIAGGGKYSIPDIKNVRSNTVFAADVLSQKVNVGETVAIIGGGDVGCETAEYLAQKGKQVTILEMMPEAASEYMWWSKKLLYDRLIEYAVSFMISTKVIEVGKGYAIYERGGILNRIDAIDTFILATGLEANNDIESLIESLGIPYYVMGDSRNPGNISTAIREGFEVALMI